MHAALIETLHTATLGTILAVAAASLVALMVARNVTRSVILNTVGRFILVATRSVHAMIWALFFVAVFGPGALAGTLAIAVHSIGFTGKFLVRGDRGREARADRGSGRAGASPLADPAQRLLAPGQARLAGDLGVPLGHQRARIGCARSGRRRRLGMALDTALSNLYWDQAGLVLFVIFAVVIVTEIATAWLQARII